MEWVNRIITELCRPQVLLQTELYKPNWVLETKLRFKN